MNLTSIFLLCLISPARKELCPLKQIATPIYNSINKHKLISPDSLNDEIKKFYKSGKLKEVAFYTKGLLDSVRTTYNPNGSLNYQATYKAGELDGLFRCYKEGQITKQIEYKNGFYNGAWIAFRKGRKVVEAQFSMGKLHGWYYDHYFDSGRIQRKAFYRDGGIVSGEYFYGEDGFLKYELISDKHENHLIEQVFYDKQGKMAGNKFVDMFPTTKYIFGIK